MIDKSILQKALADEYCVPAFNFTNFQIFKAIITTCEKLKSPVVLQLSEGALKNFGDNFVQCFLPVIKSTSVPCVLHLDHGKSFDSIKRAIDLGFDSVMIDGSCLPLKDNIELTKLVCEYAHKKNVIVEGELGMIKGDDDNANFGGSAYTNPKDAKQFVKETKVDSLAVAMGTNHGMQKYISEPKLRFDILEDIQNEIPNIPLVLHGASLIQKKYVDIINKNGGKIEKALGNDKMFVGLHKTHICKVNMDTDLRLAYTAGIREYLASNLDAIDPRDYDKNANKYLEEVIEDRIINVCHSNNKF